MREQARRTNEVLRRAGVNAAVLSSIPSVAYTAGYWPSWEMWPGYNPYVPDPAVCCAWPDREPVLLLPNYYEPYGHAVAGEVGLFPTYSYTEPLDQVRELGKAIGGRLGPTVGRLGYEPRTLPAAVKAAIESQTSVGEWIDVSDELEQARVVKLPEEIEAIRRASRLADLIQQTVKERVEPGRREIDVANDAVAAAWGSEGRRFAILVQLSTGPATAAMGGWEPGDRVINEGDLICTDTAPWLDGYWSDTCNAVIVGEPTSRHQEIFSIVNEALQAGIAAAKPGVESHVVDEACRSVVRAAGFDYPHHSGHGLGVAHTEPPRITPDSTEVIEEGMVLALEPGVYIEGWGGFRHEHVFVVRAEANEVLTRFAHRL
jgi:Xaa-Pro aminopeptidase